MTDVTRSGSFSLYTPFTRPQPYPAERRDERNVRSVGRVTVTSEGDEGVE